MELYFVLDWNSLSRFSLPFFYLNFISATAKFRCMRFFKAHTHQKCVFINFNHNWRHKFQYINLKFCLKTVYDVSYSVDCTNTLVFVIFRKKCFCMVSFRINVLKDFSYYITFKELPYTLPLCCWNVYCSSMLIST